MRWAIFSDVHGNLPALETFVAATRGQVDRYLCLGDVVNYGPWNDECLELARSLPGLVFLEGNHERLFLRTEDIRDENALVQEFYHSSTRWFTRHDLISGLPASFELDGYLCVHTIDGRRIYADTAIEITRDYVIGHSHHQYDVRRSGRRIVNCGSVGQNRRYIDVVSYALYDTTSKQFLLRELVYPVSKLLAELRARDYPHRCIDYYAMKHRRAGD